MLFKRTGSKQSGCTLSRSTRSKRNSCMYTLYSRTRSKPSGCTHTLCAQSTLYSYRYDEMIYFKCRLIVVNREFRSLRRHAMAKSKYTSILVFKPKHNFRNFACLFKELFYILNQSSPTLVSEIIQINYKIKMRCLVIEVCKT